MWEMLWAAVIAHLLGASFLGVRGMSCGSSVNSYSWTLGCRFLDLGLPGPGPGPWLPLPSNFGFFGLWREGAAGSGSFPSFRKRLSPFLSCQSVRICEGREQENVLGEVGQRDGFLISQSGIKHFPPYLPLLLQGSEAAAGRGKERLQLQLQGVQLLDADAIVFRAAEDGGVAWAQLHMLHGLEVVIFEWGAVLQLAHCAVWWRQCPDTQAVFIPRRFAKL